MKIHRNGLLYILFIFSIPFNAISTEINKEFNKQFEVQDGMKLHLEHGDGEVQITPWDKDIVDVTVRYRAVYDAVGIGGDRNFEVDFKQRGDIIYVIGNEQSRVMVGYTSFRVYEYIYEINAPNYINLELDGDDGDEYIEDWKGNIDCELDDGNIELKNIRSQNNSFRLQDGNLKVRGLTGTFVADVDDGDVFISEMESDKCEIDINDGKLDILKSKGDFEIRSDDGDIYLAQITARKLNIKTQDGEVEVELYQEEDIAVEIITDDGDILLKLQSGISADISVDSDDGDISSSFRNPEKLIEKENSLHAIIYGGNGRVRITTKDGNVRLREF